MSLRILLVEDDPYLRKAMVRSFAARGHQVVLATNGQEALTVLRDAAEFNGVLSDVDMPVMGGVALAKALSAEFSKLPVILWTGGDVQAAHDAAGVPVYRKGSLSGDDLDDVLRQHFGSCGTLIAVTAHIASAFRRRGP